MTEIAETDEDRCFSLCLLSPLLSCRFSKPHSITHLHGFLVVSIVANDISILTVYGNLTKWAIFHFEFTSCGMKDRRLTSTCDLRGGSRIFFRRGYTRLLLYFNTNKPQFFFSEYQLY